MPLTTALVSGVLYLNIANTIRHNLPWYVFQWYGVTGAIDADSNAPQGLHCRPSEVVWSDAADMVLRYLGSFNRVLECRQGPSTLPRFPFVHLLSRHVPFILLPQAIQTTKQQT